MRKISYPIDKHQWHPSLIPGPVVLISTCNETSQPNVAPKSWVQMVSFEPPILMFSGTKGNRTENNILHTGCFGVNIVDDSLASSVYRCIQWQEQERIERSHFTLVEASKIKAPLVDNCKAHLECQLYDTKEVGSGFVIFGEIVTGSIWDEIMKVPPEERYNILNQIVFLEEGLYGKVDSVSTVE